MAKMIGREEIEKVAKLARLELTESEAERFSEQLSDILVYVEKLNELNTDGVEPLAHCLPITNVFREDNPKESLPVERAVENAPQRDGNFFKVPKILDDSSAA